MSDYTYDRNGRRIKKVVKNGNSYEYHNYYYDGDRLIAEKRGDDYLYFFYDESGVCGVRYNDSNFEYVKNIFGDVIAIYDEYNQCVAEYTYDAWGNMTSCNAYHVFATINPILYRGYYYDTESGLYYLMSRYYDPEIGQFISMDTVDYLKPETIGCVDLYAYGLNNPVMYVDPTGHLATITVLTLILVGATIAGGILGGISVANEANEANGWDITFGVIKGAALGFAVGGVIMLAVGMIGVLAKYSAVGILSIKQIAALGMALYNIGLAIYGALAGVEVQLIEMGGGQELPPAWPPTTTGP